MKTVLMALAANGGIAVVKMVAAIGTGSGAMFAEAIHSSADCANQLLLLLGMKSANRAPTAEHPMGFGRDVFVASFMVSVLLFTMGGIASAWHGIEAWMNPHPVKHVTWALGVLVVGALLEGWSFRGCLKEARKEAHGLSIWQYFRESRSSEIIVVLGEDFAALIGLCLAAIGVGLSAWTGNPLYDAAASIGVGVVLVIVATLLAIEMRALLIGQSADRTTREGLREFLEEHDDIDEVSAIMTLQNGEDVMVTVKARLAHADEMTADEGADVADKIQAEIHERWPDVRWVFFEFAPAGRRRNVRRLRPVRVMRREA